MSVLHLKHQSTSSAFITAWNPYSRPSCAETNQQRQFRLLKESQDKGFIIYLGEGKHPSGEWEGEQSLLLLGISLDEAKAIGEKWEQNAIVWSDADCIPQLVLLR